MLVARWLEGLFVAHALLALSLLLGLVVVPWPPDATTSRAHALMRIICTCAVGFAVIGFLLFALGIAGLLTKVWIVAGLVIAFALGTYLNRSTALSIEYWRAAGSTLATSIDFPTALVWTTLLLIGLPETFPVIGGDPITYHLAYAADWAHAGRIFVDPFLRFPFYANTFLLYFAAFMIFGAASLCTFAVWAAGLLTALGTLAGSRIFLQKSLPGFWAALVSVALTCSVVFCYAFLRWLQQGYIDVALGAFALIAALCLILALVEEQRQWLFAFAIVAGALVGMKGSYVLLIPVFCVALAFAAIHLRISTRNLATVAALFLACSLPWYVRNTIVAGDPIPPVVHLAIYGYDALFTKSDWASLQGDLATDRSPLAIAALPFRAFAHAEDNNFRDWSITALFMLLYAAPIVILLQRRLGGYTATAGIVAVLLTGFIAYYLATSQIMRYSLLFYPLLAVCVAAAAAPLLKGRFAGPVAAVLALITIWPSPSSKSFLELYDFNQFNALDGRYQSYPGDDAYLRSHTESGYREAAFIEAITHNTGITGHVYALTSATGFSGRAYDLHRAGIFTMGDWFGPASYSHLTAAVQTGEAIVFLNDLDVDVVMIPADSLGGIGVPLERALEMAHFCRVAIPTTATLLEVRYAGACDELVYRGRKLVTSAH